MCVDLFAETEWEEERRRRREKKEQERRELLSTPEGRAMEADKARARSQLAGRLIQAAIVLAIVAVVLASVAAGLAFSALVGVVVAFSLASVACAACGMVAAKVIGGGE